MAEGSNTETQVIASPPSTKPYMPGQRATEGPQAVPQQAGNPISRRDLLIGAAIAGTSAAIVADSRLNLLQRFFRRLFSKTQPAHPVPPAVYSPAPNTSLEPKYTPKRK